MGSSEAGKASKDEKAARESTASQEQTSVVSGPVADWSGFQAYSPMPPHGYMASSPQAPHPYMWGVQQFMPPYGTPPHPYVAMYPHGGIYAHPTMAPPGSYPFSTFAVPSSNGVAEAPGIASSNMEVDGKSSEAQEKLPIKRSKDSLGNLDMITGKLHEPSKILGTSANGVNSKSAESTSEASTEGSDEHSQNESHSKSGDRPDSAEPSQNGKLGHNDQNGEVNPSHVNHTMGIISNPDAGAVNGVPNLNIGVDYWGTTSASVVPAMRGNISATPVSGGYVANGIVQSHLSIQDERELKKQRRKQSNRESARRSRLRKQAECGELGQRSEILVEENASLRAEVAHIRSDYEKLLAQNASLKERLGETS